MFRPFAKLWQAFHLARGRWVELDLSRYRKILDETSRFDLEGATDDLLQATSAELATQARQGISPDRLLPQAFALAREASRRVLGLRPFDVQVIAAIAMHQGKLAEMQTGEGKTLAAVLPAYLNALAGHGVHVLTFNDYLAARDAEWMGPVYRFLGLAVGSVQQGMSLRERVEAYSKDVTYVTAKEAGFDFLRDHLCTDKSELVHRPFHFAIVDEADSILIDEARVPLVIAGSTSAPEMDPYNAAELVSRLDPSADFQRDEYSRNVHFTEAGLDRLEASLGCGGLHDAENLQLLTELNLALHAAVLLRRGIDYIVRDSKVEIVDEFTGRVVENRRWPDGLQTAVEAKEGVPLQPQGMIRGSITLQHYLRLYPRVCGMTATAQSTAEEFQQFYDLKVVVIPPNRHCRRVDQPDLVFTHKEAKHQALVQQIARLQRAGRPVLVGTSSVAESEELARDLSETGISCQVMNARNDKQEAVIVAQAATRGAVTISTNMAGRGTDIRLGGHESREREEIVVLGGLYVIGINRHESRRIDEQLRGRAGRQGDPGESRFLISLEDDLIQRYGIQDLIPPRYRTLRQAEPLDDPAVVRAIAKAQRIIESQSFEIRRTLWRYASLVDEQRKVVHGRRQAWLLDRPPRSLLADRAKDRYAELRSTVGEEVLQHAEQQITLCHIDQCWAEYLIRIADIRENIHLMVLANQDPLNEFHRMVGREFADLTRRIDDEIVKCFLSAKITRDGIDMESAGLRGPAATWTYLINDNPFGDVLQRLFKGLKRTLVEKSAEN